MWASYEVKVPGKWVLTGEHAVLRGAMAVALPHPQFGLTLRFQPQVWPDPADRAEKERPLVVPQKATEVVHGILDSILPELLELPGGSLEIESSIPIGAGLGSSAALCVAITRWVSERLALQPSQMIEFATRLEHRFHGKSSGMDIAVICAEQPVSFEMGKAPVPLGIRRVPNFTFHDTGLRSRTADCVQKVEALYETDPELGARTDAAMNQASILAREGLSRFDQGDRSAIKLIADAMEQADRCFKAWGLFPEEASSLSRQLRQQGALATKLTGAGGGGMMVALWPDLPYKRKD